MKKINLYNFKKDRYSKARGGYSRFLNLYCAKCKSFLLLYQKDGPGILKRLYMDRIFAPVELIDLQKTNYKENRKSFHLKQGTFTKK